MRALLTGGAGFIGSHLSEALLARGYSVQVLDNLSTGSIDNISSSGVTSFKGDLMDASTVRDAVMESNPDVVFHLAGVVNLERSFEVAEACMRVNVLGTLNLLRALEARPLEAFVLASTTEVYGNGPIPFQEGQAAEPPSPYAVSKLAAEQLALSLFRTSGFPAVVTRMATSYGPRQPRQRLIPSLIGAYARGERPSLSDPTLSRDFLFVADLVDGLIAAAQCPASRGEVINLGDETTYTIGHIAETVRSLMGADVTPRFGERKSRPNEARVWASNNAKAGRLLGWAPRTTLVDGLEQTIAWFRAAERRFSSHSA